MKIILDLGKEKADADDIIHVLQSALEAYVAPRTPVDTFVEETYKNIPKHLISAKIEDVTAKVLLASRIAKHLPQLVCDQDMTVPEDDRKLEEKLEIERNNAEVQEVQDAKAIVLEGLSEK